MLKQNYNWILERWQVPPIKAHFSICGLGCYIRERSRIPDPLTVLLIPIPRLVIPDPGAVIPDPIYLVTTLVFQERNPILPLSIQSDVRLIEVFSNRK